MTYILEKTFLSCETCVLSNCLLHNTTQNYGLWQPVPVRYRTRETMCVFIESYKEGKWRNACAWLLFEVIHVSHFFVCYLIVMCNLWHNVQHVEGRQYLVEVEVEGCWGFVYQSTVISSNKESHGHRSNYMNLRYTFVYYNSIKLSKYNTM
jgi:hypothetical protein